MSTTAVTSNTTTPTVSASANQTLDQADYLKLLVTQMSSQDPLNPVSDTDFAAQLAQFSSLQESTAAAGSLANMQASSLIGATVTVGSVQDTADQVTGTVTGLDNSSGTPEISIGGKSYNLSQILSVIPTQTTSNNN